MERQLSARGCRWLSRGAHKVQSIHSLSTERRPEAVDSSELTLLRVSGSSSHDMLGRRSAKLDVVEENQLPILEYVRSCQEPGSYDVLLNMASEILYGKHISIP